MFMDWWRRWARLELLDYSLHNNIHIYIYVYKHKNGGEKAHKQRKKSQRDWFNQYSICLRYETRIVENSMMLKDLITAIWTVLNIICMSKHTQYFYVISQSWRFDIQLLANFKAQSYVSGKTLNQMVKISVESHHLVPFLVVVMAYFNTKVL